MKINLLVVGKTNKTYLQDAESEYVKRLGKYIKFQKIEIPELKNAKNLSEIQIKEQEGKLILNKLEPHGFIVLLDDKGKEFTSKKWANWIQEQMNRGYKHVTFVIGGAYGFSEAVYEKSNSKMSLSRMTFSHQMVRLFFTEQLYRGFTILNNEPYHHE